MTKLSVNINKVATLRNARGGNVPDVIQVAKDCEQFGADGITVHPRPDERHIRYADVRQLAKTVNTEFNIEGYPSQAFIDLVLEAKPAQVTLVPDGPDVLTSNAGWDTVKFKELLKEVIDEFKGNGIRTSIFIDPDLAMIEAAPSTGTDRIELYTESYARGFNTDADHAVSPYVEGALRAHALGLGVNAGHDLDKSNLQFFSRSVTHLNEVSIGHALIADALYLGLENTIQIYKRALA